MSITYGLIFSNLIISMKTIFILSNFLKINLLLNDCCRKKIQEIIKLLKSTKKQVKFKAIY